MVDLPMGGGLGGGSSDAATTLVALNRLWGCGLDEVQLRRLGLRLGADVPIFIHGHAAWAEGYAASSAHDVSILKLSGAHWKWRMHGGAVSAPFRIVQISDCHLFRDGSGRFNGVPTRRTPKALRA